MPFLGDEFTGLTMRTDRVIRPNPFTVVQFRLFAIAALKEEALLDYNEPLVDYDFTDYYHPIPPLQIFQVPRRIISFIKMSDEAR